MDKFLAAIFAFVGVTIGVVLISALVGVLAAIPVYFLFNWIGPVFGLPEITFWQAWGMYWLVSILFKSAGGSSNSKS